MKGWACCVLNCHPQKRTFGGWRTSNRDFGYFRVSFDILGSSWKRSSPRVPTTVVVSLSSRAKAFTLKARHRRFIGDSAFHTSLRGAPLLVGPKQKWCQQILQIVQNLMPHDYIKSCTVYTVVVVLFVVFFTLTDRASTIPNNTRGCQSGTWSAGQKKIRGTSTKLQ